MGTQTQGGENIRKERDPEQFLGGPVTAIDQAGGVIDNRAHVPEPGQPAQQEMSIVPFVQRAGIDVGEVAGSWIKGFGYALKNALGSMRPQQAEIRDTFRYGATVAVEQVCLARGAGIEADVEGFAARWIFDNQEMATVDAFALRQHDYVLFLSSLARLPGMAIEPGA